MTVKKVPKDMGHVQEKSKAFPNAFILQSLLQSQWRMIPSASPSDK